MNDLVLMASITTVCILITSGFWIAYNAQRIFDVHLDHVEEMAKANAEIIHLRDKLAGREVRDRLMGSTPVGRLLDGGDE